MPLSVRLGFQRIVLDGFLANRHRTVASSVLNQPSVSFCLFLSSASNFLELLIGPTRGPMPQLPDRPDSVRRPSTDPSLRFGCGREPGFFMMPISLIARLTWVGLLARSHAVLIGRRLPSSVSLTSQI